MLKKIQVLNKEESLHIFKKVLDLKDKWVSRQESEGGFDLPRFTLGAVSYIDALESYDFYLKKAGEENKILYEELKDLYDKTLQELIKATAKNCRYAAGIALPGFHIFGSDIFFEEECGKFHHDRQDELIDWKGIKHDPFKNLSFTLSIKQPKRGAGLILVKSQINSNSTWEENEKDKAILLETLETSFAMAKSLGTRCDTSVDLNDLAFIKYEEGYMFLHSGKFTHAMAPAILIQDDDMRITLQGHGILDEDRDEYLIYW